MSRSSVQYDHSNQLHLNDLIASSSTDEQALNSLLHRYNDLIQQHQLLKVDKDISDKAATRSQLENANLWKSFKSNNNTGGGGASSPRQHSSVSTSTSSPKLIFSNGSPTTTTPPEGVIKSSPSTFSTGPSGLGFQETSSSSSTFTDSLADLLVRRGGPSVVDSPQLEIDSKYDTATTVNTTTTTSLPPPPGSSFLDNGYGYGYGDGEDGEDSDVAGRNDYSHHHHQRRSSATTASSLRARIMTPPPLSTLPFRSTRTAESEQQQQQPSSGIRKPDSLDFAEPTYSNEAELVSRSMMATRSNEGRQHYNKNMVPTPRTPPQRYGMTPIPSSSRTHYDDRHQLLGDSRQASLPTSASVPIYLSNPSSSSRSRSPDLYSDNGRMRSLLPQIEPGSPLGTSSFIGRESVTPVTDESVIDPSERFPIATDRSTGYNSRENGGTRDQHLLPSSSDQSHQSNGSRPQSQPQPSPALSQKMSAAQAFAQSASLSWSQDHLPSPNLTDTHSSHHHGWSENGESSSATAQSSSDHSMSTRPSNTHLSAPPSPYSPPLMPPHLPHTRVRINHSRLRASEKGKETVVFNISVHVLRPPLDSKDPLPPLPTQPLWTIEKTYADVVGLDSTIRSKASKTEFRAMIPPPDKALFKDHAPAKAEQRKMLTEGYLQSLTQIPFKDRTVICSFLTTDVVVDSSSTLQQEPTSARSAKGSTFSTTSASSSMPLSQGNPLVMSGYLTKRGRHLGGWQTRYYVVNPGVALMYYEAKDGLKIGEIPLAQAAIGRQASRSNETDSDAYLHSFLIRATYEKDNEQDHILCAETDEIRDQWVQALTILPSARRLATPVPSTPIKSSSSYRGFPTSATTDDRGETIPPLPVTPGMMSKSNSNYFTPGQDSTTSSGETNSILSPRYGSQIESGSTVSNTTLGDSTENYPRLGAVQSPHEIDRTRSESVQSHHAQYATEVNNRPTTLLKKSVRAQFQERVGGGGGDESRGKHDSMSSVTRHSVGDVSGPMNAVPLPSGFDFKAGMTKDSTVKIERRKTKSFWGGFGRTDKSSTLATETTKPIPQPVFGIPLKEAVGLSRIRSGLELPAVVYRCVEYLEAQHAEAEEGIFRLSGSANVIRLLKDRFNTEGDVNLLATNDYLDPHAIAGLLKLYLRELPGHLLTNELHAEFLQVIDLRNRKDRVNLLGSLVGRLPIEEYTLFRFLFAHLCVIAQNSETNKMNLRNLSIVFSPTLAIPAPLFIMLLSEFDLVFAIEAETGLAGPVTLDEEGESNDTLRAAGAERRKNNRNSELYSASGAPLLMEPEALRHSLRHQEPSSLSVEDDGGATGRNDPADWFADSGLSTDSAQFVQSGHAYTRSQAAAADGYGMMMRGDRQGSASSTATGSSAQSRGGQYSHSSHGLDQQSNSNYDASNYTNGRRIETSPRIDRQFAVDQKGSPTRSWRPNGLTMSPKIS